MKLVIETKERTTLNFILSVPSVLVWFLVLDFIGTWCQSRVSVEA